MKTIQTRHEELKILHIVGRRNQGKTTLMVQLVEELTARGLRVGTIKHTSHEHELDTPGKDSHRHREAGGSPAAIISPHMVGVYLPRRGEEDSYAMLEPLYAGCDLVLIEGNLDRPGPKLEVWREAAAGGRAPLAVDHPEILAVVTDDGSPPVAGGRFHSLPLGEPGRVADFILGQL